MREIKREANEWLRGNDVVELSESDYNWLLSRVEGLVETCNKLLDYGPGGWPCGYSDAERIARAELRKAQE